MRSDVHNVSSAIAAGQFVSEVDDFREAIADPAINFATKKHAYDTILRHAAMLDPNDAGFWRAGVALKNALCAWLDFRPLTRH
jgi:hypothetical protein